MKATPSWEVALHVLAVLMLIWVAAFQPIRGDDFWWQLSRGRVVVDGTITPSRSLLTLEDQADADWLGGVPLYFLMRTVGGHAVMLTRVTIIGACLWWLLAPKRRSDEDRKLDREDDATWRLTHPWVWLVVTVATIALTSSVNVTPKMYDCFAIAALAGLRYWVFRNAAGTEAAAQNRRQSLSLAVLAGLLFIAWSNMATGIFAGLIAWLTWDVRSDQNVSVRCREHLRSRWILAACMLAGGMINPRGPAAWTDSLSALVPSWRNQASLLVGTPWRSLLSDLTTQPVILFLILSAFWLIHKTHCFRRVPGGWPCFVWMQWLAWSNIGNLALVSAWLAADVLSDCHQRAAWSIGSMSFKKRRKLAVLAGPMCVVIAMPISNLISTMGWGIDASLDNRMLQISLATTRPHGTAFADDTRSGGMLAWEILRRGDDAVSRNRTNLQLQDVSVRSIITGRFAQHRRILDDLREQRLMSYWLTDASAGGYWVPLSKRDTTLVVVSSRDIELIRGLEPSIWKPLSLDSPVIAYAPAGDAAYADRMIEILRNREIVEFQPWQYNFPNSNGSLFDRDWWGFRLNLKNREQTLRQAEVFRAMGLHYAALRVLFVGRSEFPDFLPMVCSIVKCQIELAKAEHVEVGRVSRFRGLAVSSSPDDGDCPLNPIVQPESVVPNARGVNRSTALIEPILIKPAGHPLTDADRDTELRRRVNEYLRHGPTELIVLEDFRTRTGPQDSQLMYAGLCGAIEAGNPELAGRYFQWFDKHNAEEFIERLVRIRFREMNPSSHNRQGSQP